MCKNSRSAEDEIRVKLLEPQTQERITFRRIAERHRRDSADRGYFTGTRC